MDKKRLGLWAPMVVLAAALVMLAVSTGGVDAARGGTGGCKGGPKRCGTTTTAVVSVSPNPVPLGSQSVDIHGAGFAANEYLVVTLPGVCCDKGVTTDASGAFVVTFYRNFDWASTYIVEVERNGVLVASTTFTVQ